jgi:hypothetical protein
VSPCRLYNSGRLRPIRRRQTPFSRELRKRIQSTKLLELDINEATFDFCKLDLLLHYHSLSIEAISMR